MSLEKKKISFNDKVPELQELYTKANLFEGLVYQEKSHLELLVAQVVTSCDYKRIKFLIQKIFFELETKNFKNTLVIYHTIACITLLTRLVISEGVCEKDAYSLSRTYLGLNYINLKVKPLDLLFEIFTNYMILIENTKLYQYDSFVVNEAINHILNNITVNLTINNIATYLKVTPGYLSHHFKTVTNMSMKKFINLKKIEFAKYLLSSTDLTLIEITTYLGFKDQSYFSKVFKRYLGISPSRYRNYKFSQSKSNDNY